MAIVVTADVIDGTSISQTRDGFSVIRKFIVAGVTGNADVRQYNAITATGVPAINDAHPATGLSAYQVVNRTCTPIDNENGIFSVSVEYALVNETLVIDGDPIWSVGASVDAKQTNVDKTGAPLVVTYDGKPQTGTVEVMKPNFVLRAERLESADPTPLAAAYVGLVNSDTFKGFTAGQLLCTRIEGSGNDTTGWKVTYEFQYDAAEWFSTIVYQDENGIVPSDVSAGDGIEEYDEYDEIAFAGLGL